MAGSFACSESVNRHPVPAALRNVARVPGMPPGIRTWGDQFSPAFQKSVSDSDRQVQDVYGDDPPRDMLALSGGGSSGAFGAGLLCGWTDHGDRPIFRAVTGISAGAIIAPFAFSGSDYDPQLVRIATQVSNEKVYSAKGLLSVLGSDSLVDTQPLVDYLSKFYDDKLLRAVAVEGAKGRRLFIATSNLDAQRPVLWDLTAVAAVGGPRALETFRKVILASAAIPVLFPPVYMHVTAGGKDYDEMHVDGGVSTQIVLYGSALNVAELRKHDQDHAHHPLRTFTVYIIRNAKLSAEPLDVGPKLSDIASRSVAMLTKNQGIGDLYVSYDICKRDQSDFRLVAIPDDVDTGTTEGFDPGIIRKLFERGLKLGRAGVHWSTEPPFLSPATQQTQGQLP